MSLFAAKTVAPPVPASAIPGGVLRRKCACGAMSQGEQCESCERRKNAMQRKPANAQAVRVVPGIVRDVLRSSGTALDATTRAFMEPRFGYDFSRVRVHDDATAARSARAVNAHAYTLGSHVVFGDRQYAPHTRSGRELLAHELAHVVQQRGTTPAPSAPIVVGDANDAAEHAADRAAASALAGAAEVVPQSAPRIRRKIAKDFDKIKDDLTYGLFDWAITDNDARHALAILKMLSEPDLKDTIAAMDREGIVGRLLDQLPESDVKANQDFLKKVARLRQWTEKTPQGKPTTREGSCNPEQAKTIALAHDRGISWLDQSIQKVVALRAAPKDAAQKAVSKSFNTYFFSLDSRVIDYVLTVLRGVRADFGRWDLFRLDCFGAWASSCHGAGAYANAGPPLSVTFCPSYFENDYEGAARTLIHEIAHIQPNVTFITDRAYRSDRLIRDMAPEEALSNADSYALLAWELVLGKSGAYPPSDEYQDCPDAWTSMLKAAAERAQRSNRNAQVWFADITAKTLPTSLTAQEQTWLGGKDDAAIKKALDAFDKAEDKFSSSITFECEPDGGGRCNSSDLYWYAAGDLHVCPAWTKYTVPDRELNLLAGFYGYIGAGDNGDERLRFARLATSVSRTHWAAPTLANVLGGPTGWTADDISIEMKPIDPPQTGKQLFYIESGTLHQRMSNDLPVYQGPRCNVQPLRFRQHLDFVLDGSSTARPQPFLAPQLDADYQLIAAGKSKSWHFSDRRPAYQGAGQPLKHQMPDPIDFKLDDDGRLHIRITITDPSSGVTRLYEDDQQIQVKGPCP